MSTRNSTLVARRARSGAAAILASLALIASLFVAAPAVAAEPVSASAPAAAAALDAAASAPDVSAGIVKAAPVVGFDPENIISDALFYDGAAMTAAEIQSFLDSKIGRCENGKCLNVINASISDKAEWVSQTTGQLVCSAIKGGTMKVSELIYRMQTACGISAKVILVTLQKEQGLVTSTAPSDWNLQAAMGASCPDTAPCDPSFKGVGPQIFKGTQQLKTYKATRFARQPGVHFIGWSPNSACGGTNLNIRNYATAALYNYTPYQPNKAALNAGYGIGDGCSSYGNRNFYNYYTQWFGSTQGADTSHSPFGGYNLVVSRGQVTVQGWAIDPDAPTQSLSVVVRVNGEANWASFTADAYRPDVAKAYPGVGDRHGMDSTFEVRGGDTTVCVAVKNAGIGSDADFGCTPVFVESASPHGGTTIRAVPGGIHIEGWTVDTDTRDPLAVHVYIDGVGSAYKANAYRPDVGAVFKDSGDNHGIDLSIPTTLGAHQVCVYGINVGLGFNMLLGECTTVRVTTSADPVGAVDSISAVPGGLRVKGWVTDPNATGPMTVHAWMGSSATAIRAQTIRTDARVASGSTAYGFDAVIPSRTGSQQVCLYGINVGWGGNVLLGCGASTVLAGDPFGGMDVAIVDGDAVLRGWSIDPDTTDSIPVHVYVDGASRAVTADASRPDVGRVYPGYGNSHGIDAKLNLSAGRHSVCAYGINSAGGGGNALLGCQDIVVPNRSPFGGTDATVVAGGVQLRGWTIDPDTTGAIAVHVYADGVAVAVLTANASRPDVAGAYPGFGAQHGLDAFIPLSKGAHQVCSYGINVGRGSNSLLACQSVVVV